MAKRWGKKWKKGQILFSGAPKPLWTVTAAMKLKDACSLEGKWWVLLDRVLKSRAITLLTKVHRVKAMVCPVAMYGCKSWIIRQSEFWRSDAFKLWCWRRLLRVPRTARRSNQSNLKKINCEYWLEGLMVKLQYFGYLMWRASSLEKILMLEKIEDRRRRGHRGWDGWVASPAQWTWVWANLGT